MPESNILERIQLSDRWDALRQETRCPYRLKPFVGSRVLDEERDTAVVELSPGMTADAVAHLTGALASFFDLPLNSVYVATVPEKARRVKITFLDKAPAEPARA